MVSNFTNSTPLEDLAEERTIHQMAYFQTVEAQTVLDVAEEKNTSIRTRDGQRLDLETLMSDESVIALKGYVDGRDHHEYSIWGKIVISDLYIKLPADLSTAVDSLEEFMSMRPGGGYTEMDSRTALRLKMHFD